MQQAPNPLLLIAELSYKCPLHCPYCSNPLSIGSDRYQDELSTVEWARVFDEAADLGVLQLALTGGEPLVRRDAEELVRASAKAGLYSTLVTAGTPFTEKRAKALLEAGLDHVQISIQDSDPVESDRIAGVRSFSKKIDAAHVARELGFPLTINVVLHRQNLDRIEAIIALAEELGARRVELANTQYQGWAAINRPRSCRPGHSSSTASESFRRPGNGSGPRWRSSGCFPTTSRTTRSPAWAAGARMRWSSRRTETCCRARPRRRFPSSGSRTCANTALAEIWFESEAFNRFRGTDWMPEPCRTCPVGRQDEDHGGCRCQALALVGDPTATDPVCQFSPHHSLVVEAREAAERTEDDNEPHLPYARRSRHLSRS